MKQGSRADLRMRCGGDVAPDLTRTVAAILASRERTPPARSTLVAISGIDGSGKGYVSERLRQSMIAGGVAVASINVDGWLSLPEVRFSPVQPAEHFYEHAIRFSDLFHELVLPLRDRRSVDVEMDYTDETARGYCRHRYSFSNIDVVLLEGIFLFKRELREAYDLSIWIESSFDDALARAVRRRQEGLAVEDTIQAYRTIYFPAQEWHFRRDEPHRFASLTIYNCGGMS